MRKLTAIVEGANDTIKTLRVIFHAEKLGLFDADEIKKELKTDAIITGSFLIPMSKALYYLEEENKIESLKDNGNIRTSYAFFSLDTDNGDRVINLYDTDTIEEAREEHDTTNIPYISYEYFLKIQTPEELHSFTQSRNTSIDATLTLQ